MSTAGFPDSTVRESRCRVPAAILNAAIEFPIERVPITLAPADEWRLSGRVSWPSRAALAIVGMASICSRSHW